MERMKRTCSSQLPPSPEVILIWFPVSSCLDMEYDERGMTGGSTTTPAPAATASEVETAPARLGTADTEARES